MQRRTDAEVWQSLGEHDADWAVATTPGRKHGGWSDDLAEFYAAGEERVREALQMAPAPRSGRALDWGAGTGRLSFALAERFERVTCVDISTSMQELLAQRAEQREITNLDLVIVDEFSPAGDHDFALSLITMQHFSDRDAVEKALTMMVRALGPGGKLVVEIPLRAHNLRYQLQPRFNAYRLLRRAGLSSKRLHTWGLPGISMLRAPREWVTSVLQTAGARVLKVSERRGSTHQQAWYVAERLRT